MRREIAIRQAIATVLMLFAVFAVVAHCVGCGLLTDDNAQRTRNALNVEQYRKALDECVAEGKDAGSIAVYSRCAGEADKRYGAKP